ncbi:hypothetical protein B0H13DRAFT_2273962 [Mycena leptocephala]|nr:hypothetical protein B0H13DRAFT_2155375 [Mycena leptocephala]KAJ7906707.1 hypothetical protein B0H13DRAFT_2273962 [Mycena leptocephala]
MAPICLSQGFVFIIMGFQGHVLHLANGTSPTVVVGMPRSSPTIPNQQWEFLPINGPIMTEGFIESGVQGIFLTVEKQPTPASVQATGQQSVLFFNFANCVNSTAGTLLLANNGNPTLALTAWPMQSPDLPTPVTYEEYLGLESQIWTFIPA